MTIQSVIVRIVAAAALAATVGAPKPALANTSSAAAWPGTNTVATIASPTEAAAWSQALLIHVAPGCPGCWLWWAPDDPGRNGA